MTSIRFFLLASSMALLAQSATINNRVSADPEIECSSDTIIANFATASPFEGHVYVKGHYGKAGCRTDATLATAASLAVPFDSCGVRRQRSSNPAGLYISVTVVISFHPMFITMVDKAYNIRCFYMETDKTVNADIDVSLGAEQQEQILVMLGGKEQELASLVERMNHNDSLRPGFDPDHLTTSIITQSIPMPSCKYEVVQDEAENAPVVKFATVGQQVYHKWSCAGSEAAGTEGIFCMTVHSCYVNDNEGREVQLLDESGCALDRFVLNNLRYPGDMDGGQTTMVFKFADQNSLFFQCQIRLSLKEGGFCQRTSDACPEPSRGKRSLRLSETSGPGVGRDVAEGQDVDVFSESITVFDIDEPISDSLDAEEIAALNRRSSDRRRHSGLSSAPGPSLAVLSQAGPYRASQMCLSPVTFGILLSVLGVVLLASLVSLSLLCLNKDRRHPVAPLKALG